MCGIAGGIGVSAPNYSLLHSQLESLKHRGPDDKGTYIDSGISLGMCRLAIVEIHDGRQPGVDLTERIHLVFNGEIYNYLELKYELAQNGIHCKSSSESEILANLYIAFGLSFVQKLNGMFAIAVHDSRDDSLHLIRDRVGKKPLWITQLRDGTLLFASEVRALVLARSDLTFRKDTVSEIMQYGYVNAPNSAYNEINQVPPGVIFSWKSGDVKEERYWAPPFENKMDITYNEALEITREKIESSIKKRLVSERPLGSFLSGGYDSTVVTALMAKLMKDRVQTFSIGFENPAFNEAHHAKRIAAEIGTNHHEEIIRPDATLIIETLTGVLDQPFADSSIIPTYLLAKFAKENLIVALSGDGGDEVFGGYNRYLAAPLLQKFNGFLQPTKLLLNFLQKMDFLSSKNLIRSGSQMQSMYSLGERYLSIQSLTQKDYLEKLIMPEFRTDGIELSFLADFTKGKDLSKLDQLVRSDFSYYLPGDILSKVDMASMANSLEVRCPMLDFEVVEWGLSLPDKFRISRFETKHILKDLARTLVPSELIDRPKMGFGIPRAEWLRGELKTMLQDTLTDASSLQRGWFNSKEIERIIKTHMSGKDMDHILWPMLMLELWAKTWLD
jgi:asparagine synthase (glutamine-hydrolysing)